MRVTVAKKCSGGFGTTSSSGEDLSCTLGVGALGNGLYSSSGPSKVLEMIIITNLSLLNDLSENLIGFVS